MPLPLPIMIPFMMWQSAAIAAGFGTMFQYSKRKISALSNEEFNALHPVDMINETFDDILGAVPGSFERVRSLNTLILQSLADFLEDGVNFLSKFIGGTIGSGTTEPVLALPPAAETPSGGGINLQPTPGSIKDQINNILIPKLLAGSGVAANNYNTLKGHLENFFAGVNFLNAKILGDAEKLVKDFVENISPEKSPFGSILPETVKKIKEIREGPPKQGKIFHPSYNRQLKSLLNNRSALLSQLQAIDEKIKIRGAEGGRSAKIRQQFQRSRDAILRQLKVVDDTIRKFIEKFRP